MNFLSILGISVLGISMAFMTSCSFHQEEEIEVARVGEKNIRNNNIVYDYFGSDDTYDYFKINGLKFKVKASEQLVQIKDKTPFVTFEKVQGKPLDLKLTPGRILPLLPAF